MLIDQSWGRSQDSINLGPSSWLNGQTVQILAEPWYTHSFGLFGGSLAGTSEQTNQSRKFFLCLLLWCAHVEIYLRARSLIVFPSFASHVSVACVCAACQPYSLISSTKLGVDSSWLFLTVTPPMVMLMSSCLGAWSLQFSDLNLANRVSFQTKARSKYW